VDIPPLASLSAKEILASEHRRIDVWRRFAAAADEWRMNGGGL